MSSYFDVAQRAVRDAGRFCESEAAFAELLRQAEDRVIRQVSLVTGDREFPDDLRERIQGIIAVNAARPARLPPTQAGERSIALRTSFLLQELHLAFHDVAARKVRTRFGRWTDDPESDLHDRDAFDR